ncbi:hypothetical protein Pcac1_g29431 [Phytophthora cactorum]|nr:hypothetical protein Pcac1_g29431 [Phytophthora cactorum]
MDGGFRHLHAEELALQARCAFAFCETTVRGGLQGGGPATHAVRSQSCDHMSA